MSDAKHTPGPWRVQMHKARNWRVEAPRVDSVVLPPLPIAMVIGPNQNAHLIAAAPDLFAALEEAAAYIPHADIAERARAAIKKARGEK